MATKRPTTNIRNSSGMTLPFALILTFIFSALVAVSYMFVSINLLQMQTNLQAASALSIAEGINERVKARLNSKSKIQPSPKQEKRLKAGEEPNNEEPDEEVLAEDQFNESTEDFDEYYADEILKISRYITFREPPEEKRGKEETTQQGKLQASTKEQAAKPEANVEMIGNIEISRGTVLAPGIMIVVFKNEKVDLMLKEIVTDKLPPFKQKLPIPIIKSLIPNYSEANQRSAFAINGDNLSFKHEPRFTDKNIVIEDIKGGPTVEFLIGGDVMSGLSRFYWNGAPAEYYIIPTFDGSLRPTIYEVTDSENKQLLTVKSGQRNVLLKISGQDIYLKKATPVIIPDVVGIIPTVKDTSQNGKEIIISLEIKKNVEPGTHSLIVATEGGLSNAWIFSVLPPDETLEDGSYNTAIVSSSLTLLELRVVDNLLPLIEEEGDNTGGMADPNAKKEIDPDTGEPIEPDDNMDITEKDKLGPFANIDLEIVCLLETTARVGMATKTVSEIVQRQIPNIQAALTTNSNISFDGGSYQFIGVTTAMTKLAEPTYLSNTALIVEGPSEEGEEKPAATDQARGALAQTGPKSPGELGFTAGSLIAVYKEGNKINDLDYSVISNVKKNTIELASSGLMDFHYQGDDVFQFVPPIVSREKYSGQEAEKHILPKDFALGIPHAAMARNIFRANIDQFAELADYYSINTSIPKDEYEIPYPFMGLSYIDATPVYDNSNNLNGKGILIIDTRADNQGKPDGTVELVGDSKTPVEFTGVVYVHGNLRIEGNVTITGALVVDNDSRGQIQVASNALGRVAYDARAIRQTILYLPFTTKPGTVMISNKPIDLTGYVESGSGKKTQLGAAPSFTTTAGGEVMTDSTKVPNLSPEEALLETAGEADKISQPRRPKIPTITVGSSSSKSAEDELIDLF